MRLAGSNCKYDERHRPYRNPDETIYSYGPNFFSAKKRWLANSGIFRIIDSL